VSDPFLAQRERMVEYEIAARGIRDERVLAAMREVPRHLFCDPAGHPESYNDHPLQIGEGQTISQPYMVALMTEYLRLAGPEKVLEIGTGSGYQTAILAKLAAEVFSVERVGVLARRAEETLRSQGYDNVQIRVGDGTLGWPEHAPYDRIIVTAGAPQAPPSLTGQLADGGLLVIPVGSRHMQTLSIITRDKDKLRERTGCSCIFVKLIGEEGWGGQ